MRIAATPALLAALAAAGCSTGRDPEHRAPPLPPIGAIGGAVGGYMVGDLAGGRRERGARLAGLGIGAVPGAEIGAYMNGQEAELRALTRGTDVRVVRQGDDLLVDVPAALTFAPGSAEVAPSFRRTLDQVADVIARHRQTFVDVYAHADGVGSEASNRDLSRRRADSVAAGLAGRGVERQRIATRGYGATRPLASNETAAGRAANRRVEIRLAPVTRGDVN